MILTKRLERTILEKFNQDKRKALAYLREKCTFYARKADSKFGTPFYEHWRKVYLAYSSAEFRIGYFLSLDEEALKDDFMMNEPTNEPMELYHE